jgi:hypothetical protein
VHGLAASVLLRTGEHDQACERVAQSLRMLRGTPYLEAMIEQLETVAVLDTPHGDLRRVARLIGHADATRARERMLRPPVDDDDVQRALRTVRASLGDETETELLLGTRLSTAQAVELALAAVGSSGHDEPAPHGAQTSRRGR